MATPGTTRYDAALEAQRRTFSVTLADFRDPTACPLASLPFAAAGREAFTDTDLLDMAYRRAAIAAAWHFNLWRGTLERINHFADQMEITVAVTFGTDSQNRIISATAIVGGETTRNGSDLEPFITRVLERLLLAVRGRSVTVVFSATPPSAPRNLRSQLTGATSMEFRWDVPTSMGGVPITGYRVGRKLASASAVDGAEP